MTPQQIFRPVRQTDFPETSLLGILFFLMGAPHIYGALRRRAIQPRPAALPQIPQYVALGLLAVTLMSVAEFLIL